VLTSSFRNPIVLSPRDAADPNVIQIVIETPKGSRNKYAFDTDQRIVELKSVLPVGAAFPPISDGLSEFYLPPKA
jgi:inorganic pyrophosphatase